MQKIPLGMTGPNIGLIDTPGQIWKQPFMGGKFLFRHIALLVVVLICTSADGGTASREIDRGLQAIKVGDSDRAIRLWTKAINRNPECYAAYVNRGSAYIQAGHIFRGILDWHKARSLSPVFAFGLYSGLYIRQASGNALMLNYAASLELDPDHVPSVVMTGAMYSDLGLQGMAVELFRKSEDLTKNPLLKNRFQHWVETLEQ